MIRIAAKATLVTETLARNPTLGKPNLFMDPRRAMLGVRVYLGR